MAEPRPGRRPAIPAPTDRIARNLHFVALAILAIETVYWSGQPCKGDFLCPSVLGFLTLILFVPGALAVAVWRAGHGGPLILADAFVLAVALPLLPGFVEAGVGDAAAALLFIALPAILLVAILGPIRDVAVLRTESIVTAFALIAGAAYAIVNGWPALGIVPLVVFLVLWFAPPRSRPRPSVAADDDWGSGADVEPGATDRPDEAADGPS